MLNKDILTFLVSEPSKISCSQSVGNVLTTVCQKQNSIFPSSRLNQDKVRKETLSSNIIKTFHQ